SLRFLVIAEALQLTSAVRPRCGGGSLEQHLLRARIVMASLLMIGISMNQANSQTNTRPGKSEYQKLAAEMEVTLRRDVLGVWFPRAVNKESGGFDANFTRDWQRTNSEGKFSVFQGRMVWVASQVMMHRPELKQEYQPIVVHGFSYLNDVLWDKERGGFYWGLDDRNSTSSRFTDGKHLYGISFGLYGATAAYQATKDQQALDLAKKTFHWLDEHAHDSINGGYFEWLTRDGKAVQSKGGPTLEAVPVAGFPIGYKSMNTHIHLLESFTQLYEIWPDDLLRKRLQELLEIVRDKICVEPGVMNLYFTTAWQPIPDHDSYGHDVETAYLILEAEAALRHTPGVKTEHMAKLLVDHALAYGWDDSNGGFYREGTTFGAAEDKRKEWWVQFEGLNALLLMHEKFGKETNTYFKAFKMQWAFIRDHQIDKEYGGVFDTIERDGSVTDYTKSRIWKECYHETRALLNTIARLERLASLN
ncbi:MAG TPA: AGE family epimerase/isomerase, partial [Pyrinomonadaceae bacterium]|nr:AGE family epimerase/isomerase [Pyrinomonadaceae bacterium]